jgi:hypothetical protein
LDIGWANVELGSQLSSRRLGLGALRKRGGYDAHLGQVVHARTVVVICR